MTTELTTIPDPADGVRVKVAAPLAHRCPHADETDIGTVTAEWTVPGRTIELHSLAAYFTTWAGTRISHEQITDSIRDDIRKAGMEEVAVTTTWNTAGMGVIVTSEVAY